MFAKFLSSLGTFGIITLFTVPTLAITGVGVVKMVDKVREKETKIEKVASVEPTETPRVEVVVQKVMPKKGKLVDGKCVITVLNQQYDVTAAFGKEGGDFFDCGKDMTTQYKKLHGSDVTQIQDFLLNKPTGVVVNSNSPIPTTTPAGTTGTITKNSGRSGDDEREDKENEDKYEVEEEEEHDN
ncbi:hypothetical protein KBC75_04135 [Candidatus Shapirobacteria bacterium]|nr:hypothetical protein [Candidatus Shapirobacteria bacterium]